jgi:acetoin utilization protein AcuB
MNTTVAGHMSASPHTIGKDQPLAVAHKMMRQYRIRHLPVLDRGIVVGVLSQRDLYFIESLGNVDPEEVSVEEAMSQPPYVVDSETPIEQVVREMAKHKYGCAVVADKAEVIGLFTTVDALVLLRNVLTKRSRRA